MKKTYNINISGYGFVIDEDAYKTLDSYLTTLSQICDRAGEKETANDIEQRIAELFVEKFEGKAAPIISIYDVEEVITRMGAPEEIMENGEAGQTMESPSCGPTTPPPYSFVSMPVKKRLYRDVDNKVLGGVCSGLAWYIGIDPVWVRIIVVCLTFLSVSTMALIYIILWLVIPPAKTPFERMQMMGMSSSMRNVGRAVTGGMPSSEEYARSFRNVDGSRRQDVFATVGNVILIILGALALIIVGSLLLAVSVGFIAALIGLSVSNLTVVNSDFYLNDPRLIFGCVTGCTLVVGIPLFLLFRTLIGSVSGRTLQPLTLAQKTLLAVFFCLGAATAITCGILL